MPLLFDMPYDRIDVHIVPTASFFDDFRDFLIREIENETGIKDVRVLLEDEIDAKIAGKYRGVRSDVSAQAVKDRDR